MAIFAMSRLAERNVGLYFRLILLLRCSASALRSKLLALEGLRRVALKNFYTNEGDARMKLEKNELVTRVFLPRAAAGHRGAYRKLRVRGSIDYPLAGVAVSFRTHNGHVDEAQVAITAVNPAPFLVPDAHKLLNGNHLDDSLAAIAGDFAANVSRPLTTSALTPEYRREMVKVLTKRALLSLGSRS